MGATLNVLGPHTAAKTSRRGVPRGWGGLAAVLAGGVALAPGPAHAQDVPPQMQAVLVVKAVAYDQSLKTRAQGAVNVVVLFRPGHAASESGSTAVTNALTGLAKKADVAGLPLRVVAMPYTTAAALDAAVQAQKATVVFVGPGLADAVGAISGVTRKRSVLTACGSEEYVRAGLSMGIVLKNDKPSILVNLAATRAEGASLDANLLRIAQVIM